MEKLLRELNDFNLKELEKNNEIIYFNYLRDLDFSQISKEELAEVSTGDSHALVGDHLYIKDLGMGRKYILYKPNFLESKKD